MFLAWSTVASFMVNIGDDAPDFSLLDQNNNATSGSQFKGQQVVLAFFPAAFTGVCATEMCTFQENLGALNDANAVVLGICVDSRFANNAFAEANGITFPILSDYTRSTVEAYGVALTDFAGMEGYTASERAVFIVDADGNVAWKWVGENPGVEPDYAAVLAALA
jgi:peroxiredoxin